MRDKKQIKINYSFAVALAECLLHQPGNIIELKKNKEELMIHLLLLEFGERLAKRIIRHTDTITMTIPLTYLIAFVMGYERGLIFSSEEYNSFALQTTFGDFHQKIA